MRCSSCSTVIPHQAKYCPKCGTAAPADDPMRPRMAAGAVPATGPIPHVGKLFLLSVVGGLGLIVGGIYGGNVTLVYAGVALLGLVLLVSLIGHHVT